MLTNGKISTCFCENGFLRKRERERELERDNNAVKTERVYCRLSSSSTTTIKCRSGITVCRKNYASPVISALTACAPIRIFIRLIKAEAQLL